MSREGTIVAGYIVPGMPHPLLVPERNAGWASLRASYERVAAEIARHDADLLILYSTQWISIIGHQVQADPEPVWHHVDPEWHDLGDMPYRFRIDAPFGAAVESAAHARGLAARTVAYHGFPIDTGTVVALTLLNPGNRLAASVVSCNMYADRAETLIWGKAARDAVRACGKRAVAVAVTALSNRMFTHDIDPAEDRISSLKDDEWNRKLLELLGEGRLEDVSQLAREFSAQANGDQRLKAIWWLAALMGQHNDYAGVVHDYQAIWGTGAAIVGLTPTDTPAARLEFDEEDVEVFAGERNVLGGASGGDSPRRGGVSDGEWGTATLASGHVTAPLPSPPSSPSSDAFAARSAGRVADASAGGGSPEGTVLHTRSPQETRPPRDDSAPDQAIRATNAPRPVGPYPHARRVGELLFVSGMGPRHPVTNEIPGGPVRDADGTPRDYDVAAQTRATIENIRAVLEESGGSLRDVFDVTVFLIDMNRDFATFNQVYGEYFADIAPTRTTLAVSALPTPIAVELKVIART